MARRRPSGGRGGAARRVRRVVGRVFSARTFLVALVLAAAGAFVGSAVPLIGGLGALVGVAAAGFLLGLAGLGGVLEAGLAGVLVAGVATALNHLVITLIAGPWLPVVGAVAGGLAALVGQYFGSDLRDGLTRELD